MRVFGRSRVSMRKVTRLGHEVEALWQQRRFGESKASKLSEDTGPWAESKL